MLDASLAGRYANALYRVASKQGTVGPLLEEMKGFMEVLARDAHLKKFFLHPAITPAEKKQLLGELVGNRVSRLSMTFLSILLDAKRMNYLDLVYQNLVAMDNQEHNKVTALVSSLYPLDAALQRMIKERLSAYLHKEVDLEFTISPDLLGGITVTIEDKVIDGSILTKLKKMEEKIALG